MSIAKCLKKLRAEKGWSQGDLARATGFERPYISRLETGKIHDLSLRNAMKLARAFNLTVERFWEKCLKERGPIGSGHRSGGPGKGKLGDKDVNLSTR